MKLWLVTAVALMFLSGCSFKSTSYTLQNKNAKQRLLIQQQQAEIATLQKKLNKRARIKRKKKTRLATIPRAPKKNIKLKKVEDNNYSSGYMYPGAKKKKKAPVVKVASVTTNAASTNAPNTSTPMNRAGCIAMIGQSKFDKYTQMFGGEAGSIKRCKMLKSMK